MGVSGRRLPVYLAPGHPPGGYGRKKQEKYAILNFFGKSCLGLLSARSLGPPASAAGAQRYLIYISPVPPGSGEPESNQSSFCDTCALAIILRPSGSVSLCAQLITETETGPSYKRFGPVFAFEFSIFCRYLQSLLSFRHSQQASQ